MFCALMPCRSASAHQLPAAETLGPKMFVPGGDGVGGGVGGSCGAGGSALPPCEVQATSATKDCARQPAGGASCAGEIVHVACPMHCFVTAAVVLATVLQLLLLLKLPHAPVGAPKSANWTTAIVAPATSQLSLTGCKAASEPPQKGLYPHQTPGASQFVWSAA